MGRNVNRVALVTLALICGTAIKSNAQQAALLSELYAGGGPNGNGSLIQDDKTFWFFGTVFGENLQDQFHSTNFGTTADIVKASDIEVSTVTSPGQKPGPGVRFTSTLWNVDPNEQQDTSFHYVVTTGNQLLPAGGPNYIEDASLDMHGAATTGSAHIHIAESFMDENQVTLGSLLAELPGQLTVDTTFATTQNWIYVSKDLALHSHGNGHAIISDFDQHFSQVPEPGSVAMAMGVGITGMFGWFRRRRRS